MAPSTSHLTGGLHSQAGPPQLSGPIIVAGEEVQHQGPSQHLTLLSARKERKDGVYLSHMPREPRGAWGDVSPVLISWEAEPNLSQERPSLFKYSQEILKVVKNGHTTHYTRDLQTQMPTRTRTRQRPISVTCSRGEGGRVRKGSSVWGWKMTAHPSPHPRKQAFCVQSPKFQILATNS